VSIRLSVVGGEPVESPAELLEWLSQEPELQGLVHPAGTAPGPGEMGVWSDVLVAAVGSGGAASVLAASLKTFLSLPQRSDVTIVVTGPDGRRVEIDAKRVGDVEALVRQAVDG
jgi:hypothetical protein